MNRNNNKQPLDLTASLPVATGGLTIEDRVGPVNALKVAAVRHNLVHLAEASTATINVSKVKFVGISLARDVKPGEINDALDIPEITQPDVTTRNLSRSDELTIGFLLDCATRGQNRGKQRPPSICKVSRILRDHSESSYEPLLISIGPIHREDLKLKEFEWLKECYLNDLLQERCYTMPEETLEACLLKVNTLIPKIRESYAGVKKNYSDVELARMMVIDGCFILEFCFKHDGKDSDLPNKMQNSRIAMDLLLLENQVPFFVLQALYKCTTGKEFFMLSKVLDEVLPCYINLFNTQLPKSSTTVHDHVLGYLHERYRLVVANPSNPIHAEEPKLVAAKSLNPIRALISKLVDKKGSKNTHRPVHSIVELDRSGVNFKPHEVGDWSMTIKFQSSLFAYLPGFWSKPTLLMPTLVIDDTTELILRNFIAYEQLFPKDHYYITSYICTCHGYAY